MNGIQCIGCQIGSGIGHGNVNIGLAHRIGIRRQAVGIGEINHWRHHGIGGQCCVGLERGGQARHATGNDGVVGNHHVDVGDRKLVRKRHRSIGGNHRIGIAGISQRKRIARHVVCQSVGGLGGKIVIGGGIGDVFQRWRRRVVDRNADQRYRKFIGHRHRVLQQGAVGSRAQSGIGQIGHGFRQRWHRKRQHGVAGVNEGIARLRGIGTFTPRGRDQRAVQGINFHARLRFGGIENL